MDFIASSTITIASASIVNYYYKEVQNDILIYKNIQSYTKYGNSCRIQNMGTHALYKIWQLMPKCHIMASVHRRLSQSSCRPSELPGRTPKLIFLFFELEEARLFWLLRPPPVGLWNDNNQISTPTCNYTSIKHNLKIKITFSKFN